MIIVPAVDRPNADRWNAARSCQKGWGEGAPKHDPHDHQLRNQIGGGILRDEEKWEETLTILNPRRNLVSLKYTGKMLQSAE